MSEPTRSWKNVLGDQPVSEARARVFEQLMEAQERIAQAQYASGVSHEAVSAALDAADERLSDEERREDLYISAPRDLKTILTEIAQLFQRKNPSYNIKLIIGGPQEQARRIRLLLVMRL